MRFILELIRIIGLIFILGGLLWKIINNIYYALGLNFINDNLYDWLLWISILIFIFIIYRNSFSFYGWYSKQKKEKLSKNLVLILLTVAFGLLIIIPFVI